MAIDQNKSQQGNRMQPDQQKFNQGQQNKNKSWENSAQRNEKNTREQKRGEWRIAISDKKHYRYVFYGYAI